MIWRAVFLSFLLGAGLPTVAQEAAPGHYHDLARGALRDVLGHFWTGDATTGHIVNTSHGRTENLHDPRGGLWERATLYIAMDTAREALGDADLAQRLTADWQRTKTVFTPAELEACGEASRTNWASDDAGWSALMYLTAYHITKDTAALDRARGIVNNAFDRWMDDDLGGGMWYRDDHQDKSLYQASIILAALRLHALTGDETLRQRAMSCYDWVELHLLRDDGLYWCNYDRNGPIGKRRPDDVKEGGSPVFLGGCMAMGVVHATLYHTTGEEKYKERALRTADGLLAKLVTPEGVYINDRDAWTNGVFAGNWAREVLSLPGIGPRHIQALKATAESIVKNARTPTGFYGGSWSGPAEGPGSRWWVKNSRPEQITTSANSLNLVLAAALLEKP